MNYLAMKFCVMGFEVLEEVTNKNTVLWGFDVV
jgi:hypothetical protein